MHTYIHTYIHTLYIYTYMYDWLKYYYISSPVVYHIYIYSMNTIAL